MRSILPIGTQPYIHCSLISLVPTRLEIWKPHFSGSFVASFQLDCANGNPHLRKVGGKSHSAFGRASGKFRSSGSTLANMEAVTVASAIQTLAALAPSADLRVPPPCCTLGNTFSAFCSFKSRLVVVSWSLGNSVFLLMLLQTSPTICNKFLAVKSSSKVDVWQKPAQHCKTIIPQFKNK